MKLSVLIQGPIIAEDDITFKSIQSVRKHFPHSKIILSTWSDHKNLFSKRFEEISNLVPLFSDDPGAYMVKPNSTLNVNRVIVSSYEGLKKINTEYTLKIRSDIFFKNNSILKIFHKFNKINLKGKFNFTQERILFSNQTFLNPNRVPILFHLCDWLALGKTEDLLDMFDIPLMPKNEFTWFLENKKPEDLLTPGNLSRYMSEDYIGFKFCHKHFKKLSHKHYYDFSEDDYLNWLEIIKANFIVIPNKMMGLYSLKYHNVKDFNLYKSWTYYEWKSLVLSKSNFILKILNTLRVAKYKTFLFINEILLFINNLISKLKYK